MSLDKLRKLRAELGGSSDKAIELFFEALRIDSDVCDVMEYKIKPEHKGLREDLAGDEILEGDRFTFCLSLKIDDDLKPMEVSNEKEITLKVGSLKEKNFDKFILEPRMYLHQFVKIDHDGETYRVQRKKGNIIQVIHCPTRKEIARSQEFTWLKNIVEKYKRIK